MDKYKVEVGSESYVVVRHNGAFLVDADDFERIVYSGRANATENQKLKDLVKKLRYQLEEYQEKYGKITLSEEVVNSVEEQFVAGRRGRPSVLREEHKDFIKQNLYTMPSIMLYEVLRDEHEYFGARSTVLNYVGKLKVENSPYLKAMDMDFSLEDFADAFD